MSIGNPGKAVASKANRVDDVRFSAGRLVVALRDGRQLSIPLEFYPTLLNATPAQRRGWEIIGEGRAVYWKQLDLDLSVEGLVQGLREAIPRPPVKRAAS